MKCSFSDDSDSYSDRELSNDSNSKYSLPDSSDQKKYKDDMPQDFPSKLPSKSARGQYLSQHQ